MPPLTLTGCSASWLGEEFNGSLREMISLDVIKKVMWELHELNWRADFLLLHKRMSRPGQEIQLRVLIARQPVMLSTNSGWGIFTEAQNTEAAVDFAPEFDDGGPYHCKAQARGLLSVSQAMATWSPAAASAPLLEQGLRIDADRYNSLENDVAASYCGLFKKIMKRSPICPAEIRDPPAPSNPDDGTEMLDSD